MIADINKYVDFLISNNLTEHQFLILWLIQTKDEENIKRYRNKFGQFDVDQIFKLIEYGWIEDFGTVKDDKQNFNIYNFLVNDKFTKNVVVDEEDAYQELCAVYPKWMDVKGTKWPMIKGDPYKIAKEYLKCHKKNKLAHDRIVRITEQYFKNHPVQGNIEDYILNRRWNLLEELITTSTTDSFKKL